MGMVHGGISKKIQETQRSIRIAVVPFPITSVIYRRVRRYFCRRFLHNCRRSFPFIAFERNLRLACDVFCGDNFCRENVCVPDTFLIRKNVKVHLWSDDHLREGPEMSKGGVSRTYGRVAMLYPSRIGFHCTWAQFDGNVSPVLFNRTAISAMEWRL